MKNFSECLTIRCEQRINIQLKLSVVDHCDCKVILNNSILYQGILTETTVFDHKLPIDNPVRLSIEVNRQHPQAIVVDYLTIDGYQVLPLYQDTIATPSTNYLDFNGIWQVKIPNFYLWHHEITGQGWVA